MLGTDENGHEANAKEIMDSVDKDRVRADFRRRMMWLKEVCREWMG